MKWKIYGLGGTPLPLHVCIGGVIQHHLQNIEKTQTFDFIYPFFTNLENISSP